VRLPPALRRRWVLYAVVSAAVAVPSLLAGWIWDLEPAWVIAGMAAGFGLGGAWLPLATLPPSAEVRPRVAPQPFTRLGRTLLPLVLPLVIVLVAGTRPWSEGMQFAAGAAAGLFAWWAVLRPEFGELRETLPEATGASVALVGLAVAIGLLAGLIGGNSESVLNFEDRGGLSSALFSGALTIWAMAAICRLFSFATSYVRGVEATLLGAVVVRGIIAAGILPGETWLDDHGWPGIGGFVLIAAVALALDAAAGVIALAAGKETALGTWVAERGLLSHAAAARMAGFGLSSAALAAIAIVVGLAEEANDGKKRFTRAGALIEPQQPAQAPGELLPSDPQEFPRKLVKTFTPVLSFRADQLWLPERVDGFLADAELLDSSGETVALDGLEDLPDHCPGVEPSPCFRLTIDCPTAAEPCSGAQAYGQRDVHDPLRSGAVYARVIRQDQKTENFPPGLGAIDGELPSILIQYWFFYRYDEWTTPILGGQLLQRHEGDWESVMVGLSDQRPLFVAYSQHCSGQVRRWEAIQVADLPPPRTHPLVAVARGSQANYPKSDQEHTPDWANCAGVRKNSATLVSFASNIRDRTGEGFLWRPAEDGLIPVNVQRPPMSFPGYWGANGLT